MRVFLELPKDICSHRKSLELVAIRALSTHEDYYHLKLLVSKLFARKVLDSYIYHKYCKSHVFIFEN